ncbi:MAG: carboxypeptidase-like regulatory domain-containing protein, partial [Anaerolineales bacterium]|nr:carboxypeptidase-like regulatory domain-containing protein [Anaerolineales bacterium]
MAFSILFNAESTGERVGFQTYSTYVLLQGTIFSEFDRSVSLAKLSKSLETEGSEKMKISRIISVFMLLTVLLVSASSIQAQSLTSQNNQNEYLGEPVFLSSTISTQAQTSVTVENFFGEFGEGSFTDGYDFSAYAVQRWGESGPDNPGLSPDFYFGRSNMPVTTPLSFMPKATIAYGTEPLSSITEIPSQSDSRFGNNYFFQGQTYGMFTLEGDYVVLQVTRLYEQPFDDLHKNGMTFDWKYVEGGGTGELTNESLVVQLTTDKASYSTGDDILLSGQVSFSSTGKPAFLSTLCLGVVVEYTRSEKACGHTNKEGRFSETIPYGTDIPAGYSGLVYVEGSAHYEELEGGAQMPVEYGYYDGDGDGDDDYEPTVKPPVEQYLNLELWGPNVPIQIGGWEVLQFGGTVTSQGGNVDGATVTMVVAGKTYQTTTGKVDSGKFYYGWENDAFPAGEYVVQVTVTKAGYKSATGTVAFTLFGEGYDFLVVMDTIQPVYDPGTNVPFPGTLTLGGTPVSDWIETDVTYPDGTVETFTNQTESDGRFIRILPSIMKPGTYQLVVYYQGDRKQISQVYSFTVGAASTPTVPPSAPQPTQVPKKCEIIDVVYPSMVLMGEDVNVTGKVICTQGEEEITPQEGWDVRVFGYAHSEQANAPVVQTSGDGSFAATFTTNVVMNIRELGIHARDPEALSFLDRCSWYGPLSVVLSIEPEISLSQTDYDQGEIVEGKLNLQLSSAPQGWDAGLQIIFQIVGPIGGSEMRYLFKAENPDYFGYGRFYWQVPDNAEAGRYEVTAFISGRNIPTTQGKTEFYINDIRHTNLDAFVEPSADGWTSANLKGKFTDYEGALIPNAELRVHFSGGTKPNREFDMTGTVGPDGTFTLNLEPFDLFAAQGQANPWIDQLWVITVYADKEGYATGATIIRIVTPTVDPNLEIVSVDPPLDYLSKKSISGGISFDQIVDMNITVRVRYNNIFGGGSQLKISTQGNWTVYCPVSKDPKASYIRKVYLAINGEEKPEWDSGLNGLENMATWNAPGISSRGLPYYYPYFETQMTAKQGLSQESEISVSGKVFGYSYTENSPNQCMYSNLDRSIPPTVPQRWQVKLPAVYIQVNFGRAQAGVIYNLTPPSISASGSAWVSPKKGELNARLNVGQATGFALQKQQVNLSIVSGDIGNVKISPATEKPTSEITIEASAVTDDKGELMLPITTKTNPCELLKKAEYFVKITTPALDGNQYIPIELRCVKKLEFEMNDGAIALVQATDLSDQQPFRLVAGKEAGVRIYYAVRGEIYQPVQKPVSYLVKFELFQPGTSKPLVTQLKKVSLTETGATVSWAGTSNPPNQAGIGLVT